MAFLAVTKLGERRGKHKIAQFEGRSRTRAAHFPVVKVMASIPSKEDRLLPLAAEAIGRTPLVELSHLTRNLDVRILAKLEYLVPGLSKSHW